MASETTSYADKFGKVIFYLLKDNLITKENIHYAQRIQKKLTTPQPLLEILKELNFVDEKKKSMIPSVPTATISKSAHCLWSWGTFPRTA